MAFTQSTKKPWKKEIVEVAGLFKKSRYVFEANERGAGSTIGDFIIDGSPAPVSLKCSHEVGNPIEGIRYRVNGYWSTYKSKSKWAKNKESVQFVAETLERDSAMEFESFSAYLVAIIKEEKIPGIGMGRVSRIWKTFGKASLQKIRENEIVEFNRKNPGMQIDENAWAMLRSAVCARQSTESSMSEILRVIAGFGFPKSVAKEAHELWGASAARKIRRNAFCLMTAEIQGAGFKRCDELYRSLGEGLPEAQQHKRMKRLKRLMLRIWYEIKGGVQGNVWTEEKQLRSVVKDSIEAEFSDFGIPRDKDVTRLLDRAIALGVRAGWLSREWTSGPFGDVVSCFSTIPTKTSWITSKELDDAEKFVAEVVAKKTELSRSDFSESSVMFVRAMQLAFEGDPSVKRELIADWVSSYHGDMHVDKVGLVCAATFGTFTSPHQQEQVSNCLKQSGFGVLTGGPGTGKTRVTCALLAFAAKVAATQDCKVFACGPTGKSVARLREQFTSLFGNNNNFMPWFSTWHKMLWNAEISRDDLATPAVIIGDEHSMHDIELMSRVFRAWPKAAYLFVGDDGQLPPVGAGHVLRDMIACKKIPVGRLAETHRNEGGIVDICKAILEKKPWQPHGNVILNECDTMQQAADTIETRITAASLEGFNTLRDVQVICAVNEKGDASKLALNRRLQSLFQGRGRSGASAEYDESANDIDVPFMVGDKVVCRLNGIYESDGSRQPPGVTGSPSVSVCNGDQGVVASIEPAGMMVDLLTPGNPISSRIIVPFNVAEAKSYHKNARCNWELAYAISCHSAQGSEWPLAFVILDPSSSASGICNLEWLRTAISRGKIRAELFGKMETARAFCKKSGRDRRKTLLAERINRECELMEVDL